MINNKVARFVMVHGVLSFVSATFNLALMCVYCLWKSYEQGIRATTRTRAWLIRNVSCRLFYQRSSQQAGNAEGCNAIYAPFRRHDHSPWSPAAPSTEEAAADVAEASVMPRLHQDKCCRIQVVSTCRRQHVSCFGDKNVASLSPVCCWIHSGYKGTQVDRDINE